MPRSEVMRMLSLIAERVFYLRNGGGNTASGLVDISGAVRERAPVGTRTGHRLLDAVPVRASPRGDAPGERSPDDCLPGPRVQVGLLRATPRSGHRPRGSRISRRARTARPGITVPFN